MLIATIIVFSIIIFPIFIKVWFNFSLKEKKLFFTITLFGFLKIISGYAEQIKEGFAVHITKKKAIIIEYKNILDMRKKVKPLKDYHFIKLHTITEIGSSNSTMLPFVISNLAGFIDNFSCWFLYNFKPYLDVNNKIFVFEGEDRLEVFCKLNAVFNLMMVVISLFKILMEKMIYANGN